jgi:purine-binding chemotaxis protein CheW
MVEPFIIFQVAGAFYGVRSAYVQQIDMIENVTRVPNTPGFVDGVVYIRGQVVPVINLRSRFGMDRRDYDIFSRLIVVEIEKRIIGLAVDSAREFFYIDPSDILPPPDTLTGPGVEYLEGTYSQDNRLILVVNLHHLLDREEKQQLSTKMEVQTLAKEQ